MLQLGSWQDHGRQITSHSFYLHWLPIDKSIGHKLLWTTFRSAKEDMPHYLLILSRHTTRLVPSIRQLGLSLLFRGPRMWRPSGMVREHSGTPLPVSHPLECSAQYHKRIWLHKFLPQKPEDPLFHSAWCPWPNSPCILCRLLIYDFKKMYIYQVLLSVINILFHVCLSVWSTVIMPSSVEEFMSYTNLYNCIHSYMYSCSFRWSWPWCIDWLINWLL